MKLSSILLVLIPAISILILAFTSTPPGSHHKMRTEKEPYELVYPPYFGNRFTIPADNPLTKEGVYLGRLLFYEPGLSGNNKISCASCHQQKLAFTDGKSFSRGIDDTLTSRNSMSLANLLWVRNFFWDGRAASLEEQTITPMTNAHEMGQSLETSVRKLRNNRAYPGLFRQAFGTDSISGNRIVKAIAQFERTLISANSRYDRYLTGQYQPTAEELAGLTLFMTNPQPEKNIRGGGCGHCHGSPKLYMELFHNNGLDSLPHDPGRKALTGLPSDLGRFRVPTLRNIALTAPYMHDGRFKTLEEVLDHYSDHIQNSASLSPVLQNMSNETEEQTGDQTRAPTGGQTNDQTGGRGLKLTGREKSCLVSFLKMLTDSTFINDRRYADPHLKQIN